MTRNILILLLCVCGFFRSTFAMFHSKQSEVEITVVGHAKTPDKQLLCVDAKVITVQDFIHHAQYPMTIAIANKSDAPIVISSESCAAQCVSASQAFDTVSVRAYKKAGILFLVHGALAALTGIYIYKTLGADLYEIFKRTTLYHAYKRADAAEQKILASGQQATGWLSLLPSARMTWLHNLLSKRQHLVPFIKRTLPTMYKKMMARIAGVEYVDVDAERLFISELAVRTHGGPLTVVHNYVQLIDWRRMASAVQAKAPAAVLMLIAGIVGMLFAPYYWHELRGMNYLLHKKLKKQVLSDKSITIMPGQCITQLMILPSMAVDEFNFRIFGHDGVSEKTQFAVKLR